MSEEALQCFYAVAGALNYGDENFAGKTFVASWKTLKADERNHLRDVINAELLDGREREVSSHGIRRSFRFWSTEEKAHLISFAKEVIDALRERMGYEAVIGYGTALAVSRSNDLIPHDDDVDLLCVVPIKDHATFDSALRAIAAEFESSKDFQTYGKFGGHLKFSRSPLVLDVFVALREGDYISSIPGPRKRIHVSDVLPAKMIDLFGIDIEAPADPDKYLSKVYGAEWRVPDPIFGHNWSVDKFRDLIEVKR